MWKAIIISKSNVDMSGRIDVKYQILVDGEVKYENQTISCDPSSVVTLIKEVMADLKHKVDAADDISEGQEIEL